MNLLMAYPTSLSGRRDQGAAPTDVFILRFLAQASLAFRGTMPWDRGSHLSPLSSSPQRGVIPDIQREEYNLPTAGVRGKYTAQYAEGSNVIVSAPDVAALYPNSPTLNRVLRTLAEIPPKIQNGQDQASDQKQVNDSKGPIMVFFFRSNLLINLMNLHYSMPNFRGRGSK
jgi:hypothetical protein